MCLQGYSNFVIQHGTLVADDGFPAGEYMLQVGDTAPCNRTSGGSSNSICNSDVSINQMTFDSNHNAYGCLMVANSMDVNVGPAIMVTGYQGVGISLRGSGAGFIHEAWLGELLPGENISRSDVNGTGIQLDQKQHDSMLTNIIVFSGKVGVNSTSAANRYTGVHTWNDSGRKHGAGIVLFFGGGRVQDCYLDGAPLIIRKCSWANSFNAMAVVEGTYFLGETTIVLEAGSAEVNVTDLLVTGGRTEAVPVAPLLPGLTRCSKHNVCTGKLNVCHTRTLLVNGCAAAFPRLFLAPLSGNFYSNSKPSKNRTMFLDESGGVFTALSDTIVENNLVEYGNQKVGTRATMTLQLQENTVGGMLNFTDSLLFGPRVGIDADSVQCYAVGEHPVAVSAAVTGDPLTLGVHVEPAVPKGATVRVTCTVDQSRRLNHAH